jgi:hypothetical protein
MALALSLAGAQQSNDARILRITDNTGVYNVSTNTGGWGTPNLTFADINGGDASLTLTIVFTKTDLTVVTYDTIDIYTDLMEENIDSTDDLVYDLTADKLLVSGVAIGTEEDPLEDGWYEVTYSADASVDGGTGAATTTTIKFVLDGNIVIDLITMFKDIPQAYNFLSDKLYSRDWIDVIKPIYLHSMYFGILCDIDTSSKNRTLGNLETLSNLLG